MTTRVCIIALATLAILGCSKSSTPTSAPTQQPAQEITQAAPPKSADTNTETSQAPGGNTGTEASPKDTTPAPQKPLDNSYIAADFCAALVVHPKQIATTNIIPLTMVDGLFFEADLADSGFQGIGDVEQIVLLVDPTPGGNVMFFPAAIVRFAKPVMISSLLENNIGDIREQPFLGKTYYTSEDNGMAGVAMAAFTPDNQTLLIAPEPTLQKMLMASDVSSPLVDRLKSMNFAAEITGVFAIEPVRTTLAEVVKEENTGELPPELAQFRSVPELANYATFSISLADKDLIRLEFDGKDEQSAQRLTEMAGTALVMAKSTLQQLREEAAAELPEGFVKPVTELLAHAEQGIGVDRDANRVIASLKKPDQLAQRAQMMLPLLVMMFGPNGDDQSMDADAGVAGTISDDGVPVDDEPAAIADAPKLEPPVMRAWTDVTGKFKIEAVFVEIKDDSVTLKKTDDTVISVPREKLSQADRDYVQQRLAAEKGDAHGEWQKYTFAEAGFSAQFPAEPEHSTERDEDGAISYTYGVTVEGTDVFYSVTYDDMPQEALDAGAKAILDGVAESLADVTTSKKEIKLDGHPGMEVLMEFEEEGVPVMIKNRIFVVGSRMYQVMVVCRVEEKGSADFNRFHDSFQIAAKDSTEPDELVDESKISGQTFKLTSRSRWPAFLEKSEATATRDGLTVGRNYVRTKQGHFLTTDFRFEAVFSIKDGDSIVFVGIGEGRGGGAYQEPVNSAHLRIHHESLKSGVGLAKGGQLFGTQRVGPDLPTGTHRAVITKAGDAVTFAIDVDNDGPTDDDMELTVPDIKAFESNLHAKNTHLFFGGGGAFTEVKLTYDPSDAETDLDQ